MSNRLLQASDLDPASDYELVTSKIWPRSLDGRAEVGRVLCTATLSVHPEKEQAAGATTLPRRLLRSH